LDFLHAEIGQVSSIVSYLSIWQNRGISNAQTSRF